VLRGILESRAKGFDEHVLVTAARAVAKSVGKALSREYIMPDLSDSKIAGRLAANVAAEVVKATVKQGFARVEVDSEIVRGQVRESLRRYAKIERFVSKQK
jgi:malic enzyme